jgi:redox-sensitive bicupin YhaK (pirin superfamily)
VVAGERATIRVIAGRVGEVEGPVGDIVIEPEYLDVELEPGATWSHETPREHTVFAYVTAGSVTTGAPEGVDVPALSTALFAEGDRVEFTAAAEGARFLLISGRPLREPVAWRGPIVMNTDDELREAFEEYREGTFVRHEVS